MAMWTGASQRPGVTVNFPSLASAAAVRVFYFPHSHWRFALSKFFQEQGIPHDIDSAGAVVVMVARRGTVS